MNLQKTGYKVSQFFRDLRVQLFPDQIPMIFSLLVFRFIMLDNSPLFLHNLDIVCGITPLSKMMREPSLSLPFTGYKCQKNATGQERCLYSL